MPSIVPNGTQKPARHYRAAVRLWAVAERMRDESEPELAMEALYAAAKRSINALSNSRATNPITTRAKYRQLRRIVQYAHEGDRLLPLWEAAYRIHTYADQTPEPEILERDWHLASEFIARMLAILLSSTAPEAPNGPDKPDGTQSGSVN